MVVVLYCTDSCLSCVVSLNSVPPAPPPRCGSARACGGWRSGRYGEPAWPGVGCQGLPAGSHSPCGNTWLPCRQRWQWDHPKTSLETRQLATHASRGEASKPADVVVPAGVGGVQLSVHLTKPEVLITPPRQPTGG